MSGGSIKFGTSPAGASMAGMWLDFAISQTLQPGQEDQAMKWGNRLGQDVGKTYVAGNSVPLIGSKINVREEEASDEG